MAFRSAPAQKDSPAPVITTARTSWSSWASCSASPTAVLTALLTALRACGRFSVISRTLPRRSVRAAGAVVVSVTSDDDLGGGSSRLRGRVGPSSQQLEDGGVGLATALAHGLQAVANSLVPHVVQHRGHDAGPGSAQRVAQRDGTAVGVELLLVGADVLQPCERHRRERLGAL